MSAAEWGRSTSPCCSYVAAAGGLCSARLAPLVPGTAGSGAARVLMLGVHLHAGGLLAVTPYCSTHHLFYCDCVK